MVLLLAPLLNGSKGSQTVASGDEADIETNSMKTKPMETNSDPILPSCQPKFVLEFINSKGQPATRSMNCSAVFQTHLKSAGDPAAGATKSRHARSLYMDSFMDKLNIADLRTDLPPQPGHRIAIGMHGNGSTNRSFNKFSLEFGSAEFTGNEMKKIMADEKLSEMAMADPKGNSI